MIQTLTQGVNYLQGHTILGQIPIADKGGNTQRRKEKIAARDILHFLLVFSVTLRGPISIMVHETRADSRQFSLRTL